MQRFTDIVSLREGVAAWRANGETVGFVPTMGALHEGHLTLVDEAKKRCNRVVVSIFVNPKQFGPNEDFNRYPRVVEEDAAKLATRHADALYLPTVDIMYPKGFNTAVHVGGVTEGLCGAARPGHFNGVATVVTKLLLQVMPDKAFFGEKDYQQLRTIQHLVHDLDLPVYIVPVPTAREQDGLALSSRNQYLSAHERTIAPTLYQTLQDCASRIRSGDPINRVLDGAKTHLLSKGFTKVDYLELCHNATLAKLAEYVPHHSRLLVAAFLGQTRLIDNIDV